MKEMLNKSIENMLRTEKSTSHAFNPRIEHAILGMGDEAGELLSILKAGKYYNRSLDVINLMEELGDMWWYFVLAIDEVAKLQELTSDETFDVILRMNRAKLKERYPDSYSDEKANTRNLDAERRALEDGAIADD